MGALIVSSIKKQAQLCELLLQYVTDIDSTQSCFEARKHLCEREYSLCVINSPLPDESGVALAVNILQSTLTQVIVLVGSAKAAEVTKKTQSAGVLVVQKPFTSQAFIQAVNLAIATHHRLSRLSTENNRLLSTIDDLRIIDRAKCLLIETMRMTESEAHRYIEKQAMDMRITKKAVAANVLKTYEN